MKYFYCMCLLLVMCHGQKQKKLKDPGDLKVTTHHEPLSYDVAWNKVDQVEDDDPVLGYKVKVLEVKKVPTWIYKQIGDTNTVRLTQVDAYPKLSAIKQPEGTERIITVEGDGTLQTTITNLQPGQAYETTVAAYTNKQTGRWTEPIRVIPDAKNWQIIDLDTPPEPQALKPEQITAILPPLKN